MKIQTRTNVSNPAVECDWMFNRPTSSHRKYKRKTNLKISVHLERRCHATAQARPLPTNTKGLVKVTWIPRGIKSLLCLLVFQLCWSHGRLFKLLIKLCEHSWTPLWLCLSARRPRLQEWCGLEAHDMDSRQMGVMNRVWNSLWTSGLRFHLGFEWERCPKVQILEKMWYSNCKPSYFTSVSVVRMQKHAN